jgi:hypothetical protein
MIYCVAALGVDDVRDITVRSTGRQVKKRDIRLSDALSDAITVTLWSQKAEDFDKSSIGRIIRIRRAKVTDFNGKSLTLNFSSSIESDPKNCPESEELLAWWTQNKDSGAANCFSRYRYFPVEQMQLLILTRVTIFILSKTCVTCKSAFT